ncbi:HEAT repeat domain-containing protein [Isoptericola croceus]|uniref:HEAT repeat domain-containing protein n=1 Tax=Isoptericola croceus TaxID=3031406 RepID=UPI0023F61D86|nr:HEAT repeat domain-containing protein [Isoptericola croceus]
MRPQSLDIAIATTGWLCLGMMLLIVLLRVRRLLRARRQVALMAPYRRDLLVVGAGEDHDGAGARRLARTHGPAAGEVMGSAVEMLGKVRGTPADELIHLLTIRGEVSEAARRLSSLLAVRRARAAHVLGLCQQDPAVPQLIHALGDSTVEVRAAAAHALGLIGNPVAAPPLLRAVGATDAGIPACVAAEALLAMGTGVAGALLDGLADPQPRTRDVAAHVSGVGAFTRCRPQLRALLRDDADLTVRQTCAAALGAVGGAEDAEVLGRHTRQGVPLSLRRVCVAALGDLGDPEALPALAMLLHDPDPWLAELAAAALLQIDPGAGSTLSDMAGTEATDPRRGRPVASALLVAGLRGAVTE